MKNLYRFIFLVCLGCAATAAVVAPAPDFSWDSAGGKISTLKGLRGASVLLLVARSPKDKAFVEQVKRMKEFYQEFAARKVVCAAAFFENADARIPSDIPFLVVSNGPQLIADYGVKEHFNVIAIGPDGNIDMQTGKVLPASRLRDMAINTFAVQTDERR
jgi:hypothetical protein